MNTEQIVSLIVALLSGLATCIPLAYKLVQYVKKATQEKNWNALLGLVINLMEQAEKKFTDGATRKEWVMADFCRIYQLPDRQCSPWQTD